jgi:hydrogenase maturation protease
MTPRILIIAYGNPLRCDDGIAWRAADSLEGGFPESEVEILRLHQLAPEIADSVRQRELVLFVDAAEVEVTRPGEIRAREVSTSEIGESRPSHFSHAFSPAQVLAIARDVFKAAPKAFVITIAGDNFEHGEYLSATVANALPELIARVEQLVEQALPKARTTKDAK